MGSGLLNLEGEFYRTKKLTSRFLREGGGVFIFADLHRYRVYPWLNKFLKEMEIEAVFDPIREKDREKIRELPWYSLQKAFFTDNISPSPLTRGVKEIWYPAGETHTFKSGPSWRVVVRGSQTSSSRTFSSSPPLLAFREYGKGRVVFFSSRSSFWILNPYHFMWGEGFFLREGGGKKLLENAYSWLAEPSLKEKTLGGFKESLPALAF